MNRETTPEIPTGRTHVLSTHHGQSTQVIDFPVAVISWFPAPNYPLVNQRRTIMKENKRCSDRSSASQPGMFLTPFQLYDIWLSTDSSLMYRVYLRSRIKISSPWKSPTGEPSRHHHQFYIHFSFVYSSLHKTIIVPVESCSLFSLPKTSQHHRDETPHNPDIQTELDMVSEIIDRSIMTHVGQ